MCVYLQPGTKRRQQWNVMLCNTSGSALIAQLLHYMHLHAPLIPHMHTHWGKPRPSWMFFDPICVATAVRAARDARFDDLLFLTPKRVCGRKVPLWWPSPGVRLPEIWATRLGYERAWGIYIQHRYIYVWQLSCFSQHPRHPLIMGEVTWCILWFVFGVGFYVSGSTEVLWLWWDIHLEILQQKDKYCQGCLRAGKAVCTVKDWLGL